MDKRRKELERLYAEAFLSIYQREDNSQKDAIIIPTSRIVKIIEEQFEPPIKIEPHEVINLMVMHKFEHISKDGEFWFFVKEEKKGQVNDPSLDFY